MQKYFHCMFSITDLKLFKDALSYMLDASKYDSTIYLSNGLSPKFYKEKILDLNEKIDRILDN